MDDRASLKCDLEAIRTHSVRKSALKEKLQLETELYIWKLHNFRIHKNLPNLSKMHYIPCF